MKKSIVLISFLIFIFASCTHKPKETGIIRIIPQPVKDEVHPGFFEITHRTKIINPQQKGGSVVGNYLRNSLAPAMGFQLDTGAFNDQTNVIRLEYSAIKDLGDEGYRLDVNDDQIVIIANKDAGLFYGVQSLLQLLPPTIFSDSVQKEDWKVPECSIYDKPRFSWRGMHLDVSRHFFPVSFIKEYIDLIALHKMNKFHWHLTDDNGWRIEIKKYPKLTDVAAWRVDREKLPWREVTPPKPGEKATYGGFYTQDQIKDIVAYAAERHVEIIPEIEMPGHSSEVFAAYPELSCTGKQLYVQPGSYWPNKDIFCAGKEETFKFIEDVLTEVMQLFPSDYIHIGGDEADKAHWKTCPLCQKRIRQEGLKNEDELQSWFIKRIEKFLNDHGKKMIGWDEILQGGLAPEATVMSWRGFQGGIEAVEQGHDVVMCPTQYCYFDYYQADPDFEPEAIGGMTTLKKVYSFDPVPDGLSEEQANHILGAQGNLWTEFIKTPSKAEYMVLPRMTALAEVVWSPKQTRSWIDFLERLQVQEKRFDNLEVNYSQGSWKVNIQPLWQGGAYQISLETERLDPTIYYTLDGTVPSVNSLLYEAPFRVDSSVTIKSAIFVDDSMKETYTSKEIIFHKGVGKQGVLMNEPSDQYRAKGILSLTDGLKGSYNYNDGYWLGFQGTDLDFKLDMGKNTPIENVTITFLQNTGAWIFMPKRVNIELLSDIDHVIDSKVLKPDYTPEVKGTVTEDFTAGFSGKEARYVRVHASNIGKIPSWHEGAGKKAWIFTDEIVIR